MKCSRFIFLFCSDYHYEHVDLNLLDVFQFTATRNLTLACRSLFNWLLISFDLTSVVLDSPVAFLLEMFQAHLAHFLPLNRNHLLFQEDLTEGVLRDHSLSTKLLIIVDGWLFLDFFNGQS